MVAESLDRTLFAIADPTRRAILARLTRGTATVTELAEPFDVTMPAITKHLKVLERAGLIERSRVAQQRPCRLRAQPLREAANWIEHYRRFWEESLDRLERYLEVMQGRQAGPEAQISRSRKTQRKKRKNRHWKE